ncbi:lipopolysaccharide biosynthesis protein [Aeromonas enteropelogenes]|uniref:lipopolysaccharide biosynthesis protein n=1 Tax=Aeromonas enteropelogenes TaxID=29489 RepID=UPI003F7A329B
MREYIYTISTQLIQMLGGLAIFKMLTVILDVDKFGIYALYMSFSAFVFSMPFTAIYQALIKYVSISYNNKRALQIYKSCIFVYFCFFILHVIVFSGLLFFSVIELSYISFVSISLYIFTEIIKLHNNNFNNAMRLKKIYFLSVVIEFSVKCLALFFMKPGDVIWVFFIFSIANLISIFGSTPYKNIYLTKVDRKLIKFWFYKIYIFSYPIAFWGFFGWMRDMSNRWVIGYFLSSDQVASFSVMNSLSVLVPGVFQTFFGMYFMPILYRKEKTNPGFIKKFNKKMFIYMSLCIIIATGIIYNVSDYFVFIFADKKYISYSYMIPIMFFSFSVFSLAMSCTTEFYARNRTKELILPNVISGVISIVTFILLVKEWSLNGAVYAFAVSYISYAVLIFILVRNMHRHVKP